MAFASIRRAESAGLHAEPADVTVDELSATVTSPLARCGIWGELVEADRAGARASWLAGTPVTALLKTIPAEHG